MRRANVDEVDVEPVDRRHEVRQCVEPRLASTPFVVGRPIAGGLLHEVKRHALGVVGDSLSFGPLGGKNAPAEIVELRLRDVDAEWGNGFVRHGWSRFGYVEPAERSEPPKRPYLQAWCGRVSLAC